MPHVVSSCLDNADYNAAWSTLTLVFDNYGTYEFYAVAQVVYDSLLAAVSKGQYFNYSIRPAGYAYSKIAD